jgi:hypothetical protein
MTVNEWLEALRSGKYQQGREYLHKVDSNNNNYYCCLGVACVISDRVIAQTSEPSFRGNMIVAYDHQTDTLPSKVKLELGLSTNLGEFIQNEDTIAITKLGVRGVETSLAALNDNGATFEQIAQIIELKPQGLFVDEPSSN